MSLRAVIVRPLFNDFISGGLAGGSATEVIVNLTERWNANAAWASETGIEYAIWSDALLGSIGDPPIQGNGGTTTAAGVLTVETTAAGFSVSDTVLVAVHKPAAGPSAEDLYGFGTATVTEKL